MAESSEGRGEKLKVFVSYARDDLEFADQVVAALAAFGLEPLIDRHGISAGEDWKRRLGNLIAEADTVAFMLSPRALQSEICDWEIEETDRLSKRLLPVRIKPLGTTPVRKRFKELQNIFLYADPNFPGSGFGQGLADLVQALNTDLEWVREHTRLGQRAAEWQVGNWSENRLLSGAEIVAAKDWLARRPPKAPEPTPLHLDFIRASEDAQTARDSAERQRLDQIDAAQTARQQALADTEVAQNERAAALSRLRRRTWVGVGVMAFLTVAAVTFGGLAVLQSWKAEEQTRVARANESRALAALSEVAFNQHQYVDAVKLALAGWPRTGDGGRPKLKSTIKALGQAQRFQRQTIPPLRHEQEVVGAAFNHDETRILTWSDDGTARLWDAATGEEVMPPLRHDGRVWGAAFNAGESRILTSSFDGTARLWDISRLPRGNLIDVACRVPDHDTSELEKRYGIAITEPICGPDTPAPVWAELVD
jgi:hypothetical protein